MLVDSLRNSDVVEMISTATAVCGLPWLVIAASVALVNVALALRLVFASRSVVGLVSFMPVTFLPLAIGVVGSAPGLLQAVAIAVGATADSEKNAALLLSWALVPLVLGGAFSVPAYSIGALGRFWLANRGPRVQAKVEPTRSDIMAAKTAADEMAYQAYADQVTSSGHRRK